MAFDKNIVLAVNTRFSCISVIDGYFNFTPIWQPPFVTEFTDDDRCHLNGSVRARALTEPFPNGKLVWIASKDLTQWSSLADPTARRVPSMMSNGRPGFAYPH